jgi:murein DD-endopeptidase MepM/ murein hydrolase activator NlpD
VPREERSTIFVIIPQGAANLNTRTYELSRRRLWVMGTLAATVAAALVTMAATWWYVAAQAARVPGLRREVALLERDRQRVEQLVRVIERMERQYDQVRIMLGAPDTSLSAPTPAGEAVAGDSVAAWAPFAWPLAGRGYLTRGFGGRTGGRHPGIDLAVATGTTIRAVDAGTVLEAGEDPVYGRFVRIEHAGGYETLYAHASRLLVAAGERVEEEQAVALSGSTGASTAPHLHFEIRRHGEPLDPAPLLRIDG